MTDRIGRLVTVCALGGVLLCSPGAHADELTFVATTLSTMYRTTGVGDPEFFEFPEHDTLRAAHRNLSTGEVYVFVDPGGYQPAIVYTMENAFSGTPSLAYYTSLNNYYGSVTQIGDTYYAFSDGRLYALELDNPADPIETYVGDTGLDHTQGAAYDPVSETLYVFSSVSDQLYSVEPDTAVATPIGAVGFGVDLGPLGAEWFDGRLFVAAHNLETDVFEIGEIDDAGMYVPLFGLAEGLLPRGAALTVIPEPGALGLIVLGALLAARRAR
jgi:hypothetical protein